VATWCSLSYFWLSRLKSTCWPPSGILCVSNPCYQRISLVFYECSRPTFKNIFPYFGLQFTSFKFLVGLTFHDFCSFFIYVHLRPSKVRTNILGHIMSKNFWFLMWMVWYIITQNVLFCKEIVVWREVILTSTNYNQKLKCKIFFLEHSKDFINCNLVLYVVGRCDAGSSFVGVASICRSICFYLGMWIMH
jgi:hypothetical protein